MGEIENLVFGGGYLVLGLVLIGVRLFHDPPTGVAAAAIYLLVPYTAFHIGRVDHVWPTALLIWGLFSFRRPLVAGALVGLAAGTAFFPALLLPVWAQFYRNRGAGDFRPSAASRCLPILSPLLPLTAF